MIRVTEAYDQGCKDFIAGEYAKIAQHHLMCAPELIKMNLLATLDLLPA